MTDNKEHFACSFHLKLNNVILLNFNSFLCLSHSRRTPVLPHKILCIMILARKCWRMPLRATMSAYLLMARQELVNPIPWWANKRKDKKASFPWYVLWYIHDSISPLSSYRKSHVNISCRKPAIQWVRSSKNDDFEIVLSWWHSYFVIVTLILFHNSRVCLTWKVDTTRIIYQIHPCIY